MNHKLLALVALLLGSLAITSAFEAVPLEDVPEGDWGGHPVYGKDGIDVDKKWVEKKVCKGPKWNIADYYCPKKEFVDVAVTTIKVNEKLKALTVLEDFNDCVSDLLQEPDPEEVVVKIDDVYDPAFKVFPVNGKLFIFIKEKLSKNQKVVIKVPFARVDRKYENEVGVLDADPDYYKPF